MLFLCRPFDVLQRDVTARSRLSIDTVKQALVEEKDVTRLALRRVTGDVGAPHPEEVVDALEVVLLERSEILVERHSMRTRNHTNGPCVLGLSLIHI